MPPTNLPHATFSTIILDGNGQPLGVLRKEKDFFAAYIPDLEAGPTFKNIPTAQLAEQLIRADIETALALYQQICADLNELTRDEIPTGA